MANELPDRLPNRETTWQLLCQYTQKEGLRKHALAVEASMRHYARLWGEDEELWGQTGLIHDFDYERWPDEQNHPFRGVEILAAQGYPEVMRTAILGHAPYSGVPRETKLAKALYACDELSGFVTAVALVKPSKSLKDVDVASVKKRFKEKAFARGVHREDIFLATEELGVPLDEHIANVIQALQNESERLGL
ncbi:MAG TPA: HDIG domain-containing protein [Thermoanaerobaculia bacterium]|jgi:putative nucleotidyltransferase with HDIG domain|nr:HDIG domain-containing protein [Thermoanaerobaculia bacterium]